MKKIINDPYQVVEETIGGVLKAYPYHLRVSKDSPRALVRADAPIKGKVGICTGGGSGHIPVFLGYVGPGLLDGVSVGNVFSSPGADDMLYDRSRIDQEFVPVGIVQNFGSRAENENWLEAEIRNPLRKGDKIEYLSRDITAVSLEVMELLDQDSIPQEQVHPGSVVKIIYKSDIETDWEANSLLRKKK